MCWIYTLVDTTGAFHYVRLQGLMTSLYPCVHYRRVMYEVRRLFDWHAVPFCLGRNPAVVGIFAGKFYYLYASVGSELIIRSFSDRFSSF